MSVLKIIFLVIVAGVSEVILAHLFRNLANYSERYELISARPDMQALSREYVRRINRITNHIMAVFAIDAVIILLSFGI